MITINPDRLLADLRALASFGRFETGVDRIAFSPPDIEARLWLRDQFSAAGLDARIDRFGTVYGAARHADRAVLVGSHSDSVPRGGWLDGSLGVLYGLEIARAFAEAGLGRSGVGVDVVSFQDEEGTYVPCLGSRIFCGDIDTAELEAARAKDGRRLLEAVAESGLQGEPIRRQDARLLAFLEAHIEQGPRLEHARTPIGVVTGIVGIRRLSVRSSGQADHAGTTPMAMRRDALIPLVRFAGWVDEHFSRLAGPSTVWNIGSIVIEPGAANVVPARGTLAFEFRDPELARLDALEGEVLARIGTLDKAGGASVEATVTTRIPPIEMDQSVVRAIGMAARDLGHDSLTLASGAGHDAMILARHIPAGMLFVPSIGGRSHDVTENTSERDIVAGCAVLARAVERLVERHPKG